MLFIFFPCVFPRRPAGTPGGTGHRLSLSAGLSSPLVNVWIHICLSQWCFLITSGFVMTVCTDLQITREHLHESGISPIVMNFLVAPDFAFVRSDCTKFLYVVLPSLRSKIQGNTLTKQVFSWSLLNVRHTYTFSVMVEFDDFSTNVWWPGLFWSIGAVSRLSCIYIRIVISFFLPV